MQPILSISELTKSYATGFQALKGIDLDVREGEIFALLGPNGAGKTTLISIACGLVRATSGRVTVGGHDIARDYRAARGMVGLVPQELTTDAFETVWDTVTFSRGLFGKARDPAHIEKVLRDLSLWDKKDSQLRQLSGGMKRRVLIAKALSHEPRLLFLDEPTRRRRRRAAPRHVAARRRAAARRRHHRAHHPLHRGGRGDGRPRRRDPRRRADPGRGEGRADAEARPQAPPARPRRAARRRAAGPRAPQAEALRRRRAGSPTPTSRAAAPPTSAP